MKNDKLYQGMDLSTVNDRLYVPKEIRDSLKNEEKEKAQELFEQLAKERMEIFKEKIHHWVYQPIGTYVVIRPYGENPYLKPQTNSGLSLIRDIKYDPNTGVNKDISNEVFLQIGEVIAVGPECKTIRSGMDAVFIKYTERELPIFTGDDISKDEFEEWVTVPEQNIVGYCIKAK